MYEGYIYINAVREVFKDKVMVVVDRYHVANYIGANLISSDKRY
jgi:hypothetical protein